MNFLKSILSNRKGDALRALVDEYNKHLEKGQRIDRAEFIARHPEFAIELAKALPSPGKIIQAKATTEQIHPGYRFTNDSVILFETAYESANFGSSLLHKKINGYKILSVIGSGGMGSVYKAWQENEDRYVALKTLQPGILVKGTDLNRLHREGLAQKKLRHPNIVEVYDSGEYNGVPYIVMELVGQGRTLQTLLKESGGPLDEWKAAELILSVAHGLSFSHQRDIIHRDIKPSNIMMAGDMPKLTDFGLAFVNQPDVTRLTQAGELLGTLSYIPPEQVHYSKNGHYAKPHPQGDIYSLGATFYELLTGEPPFHADSPAKIIKKIIDEDPTPPVKLRGYINKDLEAICIKCLEKSPKKRYYSIGELADDLTRFLDGKAVKAPRVFWPLRRIRLGMDRRRLSVVASFVAISSVVFTLWINATFSYKNQLNILRENMGYPYAKDADYELNFLLKAIEDDHIESRISAITALTRWNHSEAGNALLRAAHDPDPKVRLHLATVLMSAPKPMAKPACEILLEEQSGYVAVAALKLAETFNDKSLFPKIEKITYSDQAPLRNYALKILLRLLGPQNCDFVGSYLKKAPLEARLELLNRFLTGEAAPPIPALLSVQESTLTEEEREFVIKILTNFTDVDFGNDLRLWRQWLKENSKRWRPRRCLAVAWAPADADLRVGDIIWGSKGEEITNQSQFPKNGRINLDIIRENEFLTIDVQVNPQRFQEFYIGTINGKPVGHNSLTNRAVTAFN